MRLSFIIRSDDGFNKIKTTLINLYVKVDFKYRIQI